MMYSAVYNIYGLNEYMTQYVVLTSVYITRLGKLTPKVFGPRVFVPRLLVPAPWTAH
jgi:hypothetical protein